MKKMITIAMLAVPLLFVQATKCECGSHSTGITTYTVQDDGDCCEDVPGVFGMQFTYSQQNNGVWVVDDQEVITGSMAQDDCCRAS